MRMMGVLNAPDQLALLDWYDTHQRDLPWRRTNDPWAILLSEILLQQTQVSRGLVYWQRMVEAFPTIESMAEAPVDAVLSAYDENYQRRVLSVDSNTGKAREYELAYTVKFNLVDGDGEALVSEQLVRLVRDFVFDEDAVLNAGN